MTGTYSVWVSDCSDTNTGNYALYSQRITGPLDAVALPLGQTEAGTIGLAAQSNTYTFTANAGDVIDFTMTVTSGVLSPKVRLYSETTGTLVSSASPGFCDGSAIELNTVSIPSTGTYVVQVGDCGDTNTGGYDLFAQSTPNPPTPAKLPFGGTETGTISAAAQSVTYAFTASANDVINFTMTATSGSLSPKIRLYNEKTGELLSSASPQFCDGSTIEMNAVQIPTTGTYSVLVGDCSDTNTGGFAIYSQRTNSPGGAATLSFGQTVSGSITLAAQSNTFTFSGTAKDVVDFTVTAMTGTLSPKIRLYGPTGTPVNSASPGFCDGSTIEMNTVTLSLTGTYTALVGDCGDTNTGNYAIFAQRLNNPVGSTPIFWGDTQTGKIASAAQSNTYTFVGSVNNVVQLNMAVTSGSLSPRFGSTIQTRP